MKILIINSHPYEGSFNRQLTATIAEVLKEKNEVEVINLFEDGFNPVLGTEDLKVFSLGEAVDPKVKEYQDKIKNADLLVFSFPIWWSTMPAILKGFFDKVFLKDFAYVYNEKGMLKGILNKEAVVVTTMETPKLIFNLLLKNPVKHQLIMGTLGMSAIKTKKYFQIDKITSSSEEVKKQKFNEVVEYFKSLNVDNTPIKLK